MYPNIQLYCALPLWLLSILGPSCSKQTMSLVNGLLKFTLSDMQICWNFLLKKMWVAFAVQKLLTFFSAKKIRILYIESTKTVKEMTLNELVKLTMLWTTGPRCIPFSCFQHVTVIFDDLYWILFSIITRSVELRHKVLWWLGKCLYANAGKYD